MNKAEFQSRIQEIGSCEDISLIRTNLAELSDSVSEVFDNVDNLTQANNSLTENIDDLREANMQLFKMVGQKQNPEPPEPKDPEPKKRTYENLFNEKGELK